VTKSLLIIFGGVINLFLVIFDLFFYRMLNWAENLESLDANNYGVLLTLHTGVIFLFVVISLMSFLLQEKLATTGAGKALSLIIAGFYGVRIIAQFLYFPADNAISTAMIVALCAVAGLVYLIPVLIDRRQPIAAAA
jgi:hypothetical protein